MTSERIEAFTEISHGTLVARDLAAALLPYAKRFLDAGDVNALQAVLDCEEPESDDVEIVQDAIDALNEFAAPYCYIGFHEGDGSLLGCWPSVESAMDDGDVVRVSDAGDIPSNYCGFAAVVSDHGNVTLYECHGAQYDDPDSPLMNEVWGVV